MLSPSNVCWPLKKSDCPQVAPRVFYSVTTYHQELIELVLSNSLVPKSPLGAMPRQRKPEYFVTSMAGIVFKLASLDHAIEYVVGLFTSK